MEPNRYSETSGNNGLSGNDRRALSILEHSAAKSGLALLSARVRFQLLVVWGARLAVSIGLIVCLAALGTIWDTMSTHIEVAITCEFVLTAGALLLGHGTRLWWHWRKARNLKPD